METMTVWKDRNNISYFELSKQGELLTAIEMSAITKAEIKYNDLYYNSDDYPTAFDWITLESESKLIVKFGLIDLGDNLSKDRKAELIIYDAVNTDGVVWNQFTMIIKIDAEVF